MRPLSRLTLIGSLFIVAPFVVALFIVAPLGAQYNPPGSTIDSADIPEEDELRGPMEDARLRLGVLRLQPWIGLRDASIVTATGEGGTDLTLSVGAGLHGYLKMGRHWVGATHVIPEYIWWQEDENRRSLGGRFGLGVFGFYNRLNLEISARRQEIQRFFSSEFQELATIRQDVARVGFEIEIAKPFILYGRHMRTESESQEGDIVQFSLLDQRRESTRVGVKYRLPPGIFLGLGLEEISRDFDDGARNFSHSGTAGVFEASYQGARFSSGLLLRAESLDPRQGSDFAPLDVTTGNFETSWDLRRSIDLLLYGRRSLNFSINGENSHYVAERIGVRAGFSLQETGLGLAAEIGKDDFRSITATTPDRSDDVLGLSLSLSFSLARVLFLNVGVTHTVYDSSISALDRDITVFGATVQLTSLRERFHFGEPDLIW